MKTIDDYLKDALSPKEDMSDELKARIIDEISSKKENNMKKIINIEHKKRKFPTAAAVAVAVLTLSTVTATATWKYLSANEVAQKMNNQKLTQAFSDKNTWINGETQSCDGYDISLIGLVSGNDLSDHLSKVKDKVSNDNTYAVVAISKSDGTAMPELSDEKYDDTNFLVSAYVKGLDPAKYNIFSLNAGGNLTIVDEGIQYRIMEVENIEAFADREVYLGVSDGAFYNEKAFKFDETDGKITKNKDYKGVNALFVLPLDSSKADKSKADEIVERIVTNSVENEKAEQLQDKEVVDFMSKLTPDNIDEYANPLESSRQVLTPDKDGYLNYECVLPNGDLINSTSWIKELFPQKKAGMSDKFSYTSSEKGLKDLLIETYTLNEDGTVTYLIYQPK
ncbi:hypothetical protein SAMN05216249_1119 [Acetitomaculum ruminis DSM 5522]|uniref:DUF4179 domain-containing protein n=1 Tax=Acetitomaculum ruminis DSM 5522 TaxID=1120918 RepID=A0A1I0YSS9_9FIRM|nr:hypothetical protein [Acetitomaculum ruminis]SFB15500.1 hypothetical protein SAMN05216249_1119 [Acetitomaculum ruminis DSM 5522]